MNQCPSCLRWTLKILKHYCIDQEKKGRPKECFVGDSGCPVVRRLASLWVSAIRAVERVTCHTRSCTMVGTKSVSNVPVMSTYIWCVWPNPKDQWWFCSPQTLDHPLSNVSDGYQSMWTLILIPFCEIPQKKYLDKW